jgi:hypothetical protein
MSTSTLQAPTVSLVKAYAPEFSQWAEGTHRIRDLMARRAARDAAAHWSTRYSRLVTDWSRTRVQPVELTDVRDRLVLAAFLVNDGRV